MRYAVCSFRMDAYTARAWGIKSKRELRAGIPDQEGALTIKANDGDCGANVMLPYPFARSDKDSSVRVFRLIDCTFVEKTPETMMMRCVVSA